MAKAKQAPQAPSMFGNLFDGFKENIIGAVGKIIKEKIVKMEKMVIEIALSLVFFIMGILFILIAIMFFLKKYVHLSYFGSFLVVGVIAFIIALVVYKFANKS
ncbi:Uncharacterised protein [uncultured archaeon]|nr:Uncharacterised protein [uncultured archaeon]